MASPAGLRPATPPAIPGAAAVAACTAMAVSYVAVLYAPTVILRFPPPTSLRSFLHRRFACAAVASTASALATAALLRVWSLSDFADMLAVFGIRKDHLLQAVVIPLLLTSLVYAGSFINRLWLLASLRGGNGDEVGIGCTQRLVLRIQAAIDDVMVWRNYVVAPFTEELVFRACMIPLLLCGGFKMSTIIFLSPVFFSLAHLNHLFELQQQGCNFMRSLLIVGTELEKIHRGGQLRASFQQKRVDISFQQIVNAYVEGVGEPHARAEGGGAWLPLAPLLATSLSL
ncbi:hypothetical protein PVAP13_3NG140300 [Panicum virgatum]|uniref:intramembrane prenyl-peptidase Rce1 n=1 Tax=Panicum virgatum TaxID=38727 RepID=A0A8T0U6X0_PANVG|nr:hypothetical protein PVAP13_3NG140300 [Panicum virgatum]